MSNYVEHNDRVAFHPGYYIKELIDDSGLTQEDFAKRLDTTPKNISKLVNGEQNLSRDMASKLSRMLGMTVEGWLNLQKKYDALLIEFEEEKELEKEKEIYKNINSEYLKENFGVSEKIDKEEDQITEVRQFLNVATLTVLQNKNLSVNFKSFSDENSLGRVINSNVVTQIAINKALENKELKFDRKKFLKAVDYALTLTSDRKDFYPLIEKAFREAGVALVALPDLPEVGIKGATKKLESSVMLMISDREAYSDTFWYTLFHEIGCIVNGDYGISFESEGGNQDAADLYAQDLLIPKEPYAAFVQQADYSVFSIEAFAKEIHRDPGIVLGRLERDGLVSGEDEKLKSLKRKYEIRIA